MGNRGFGQNAAREGVKYNEVDSMTAASPSFRDCACEPRMNDRQDSEAASPRSACPPLE
jgi:hypothetical protein